MQDGTLLPVSEFTDELYSEPPMSQRKKPLPYYTRAEEPPVMGLTPRDKEVLLSIFENNGVLADYQIMRLFFSSERRMKERMTLLYHNRYVDRFTRKERNSHDYMAYFLDTEGVALVREQYGEGVKCRAKDDRVSRIHHDIVVNDIRYAFRAALPTIGAEIVESYNSLDFDSNHDKITVPDGDGSKQKTIAVIPDDFAHIVLPSGMHRRYFSEPELSPKDKPRILEEKFRPQLYYVLQSAAFKERFGDKAGAAFLYFLPDDFRVMKYKRTAEKLGKNARIFFFTTYERAYTSGAFFTEPIWLQATVNEPVALVNDRP